MTTVIAAPGTAHVRSSGVAAAAFDWLVVQRLSDRRFWMVQGAIVTITVAHCGAELTHLSDRGIGESVGLHHLLVLLFLIPVVFASLRYGLEGGVLAGLSCVALTTPNLFLWHRAGWEWAGEISSMFVVVSVGVVVAAPVERERTQWRRAEQTSRRLALVNGIVEMLAEANEPEIALESLLDRLIEAADLDGVAIRAGDPPVVAVRARDPASDADVRSGVALDAPAGPGLRTYALATEGAPLGLLAVRAGRTFGAEDDRLLGAVAHHLALEFEHARVQRRERDRLKEYARAVLSAQEAERARIARDLHDDVAQPLVQLGRELGSFADLEAVPAAVVSRCEELRDVSLSTLALVRDFAHHLRPSALDDLGLVSALSAIVREHDGRCHAAVRFEIEGDERRLATDTEVAAFRIAQEALRNVEKHAGAHEVVVRLAFTGAAVRLSVEDDGIGVESSSRARARRPAGLGIVGMRERAEIVGGSFDVCARRAGGTTVEAWLPG